MLCVDVCCLCFLFCVFLLGMCVFFWGGAWVNEKLATLPEKKVKSDPLKDIHHRLGEMILFQRRDLGCPLPKHGK